MNQIEFGLFIAKIRKESGYTQASLANALGITDKAVSKWERGYSIPDATLLPQISVLLNCDIDILLSGLYSSQKPEWKGLLVLSEGETSASTIVYDKPLIFYLLSYFLLVGITSVEIKTTSEEYNYIRNLKLEQYGLRISFSQSISANTMAVFGKSFLFGANLTRTFQSYMSNDKKNIIPVIDDMEIPVGFVHYCKDEAVIKKISERRRMGRGMLSFSMNTLEEVKDVSEFVRIYQKNHNLKIADLKEISENRGLMN